MTRAHLSARVLSPERDLERREGRSHSTPAITIARRQQQVLWRRADALSRGGFHGDRACRRNDAGLAVSLRRAGAMVQSRRAALSGARRARRGSDRAAAFRALPFSAGAGRASDRGSARTPEARRPAPFPCRSASISMVAQRRQPWDAFPDARTGKMDAETCALAAPSLMTTCPARAALGPAAHPRRRRQAHRGRRSIQDGGESRIKAK